MTRCTKMQRAALLVIPSACLLFGDHVRSPRMADPRAGLWEAVSENGGAGQDSSFHVEIRQEISGVHQPTETISGLLAVPPEGTCPFRQQETVLKRQLILNCLAHKGSEFVPDGRHLDVTFADDGTSASAVWHRGVQSLTLNLRRFPKQPASSPVVGEWIARGLSETCVLHISVRDQPNVMRDLLDPSKLVASLDVFGPGGGIYGMEINGIADKPEDKGAVDFSLHGTTGASRFIGHLDESQQRIVGSWPGHSDCDIFTRTQDSKGNSFREGQSGQKRYLALLSEKPVLWALRAVRSAWPKTILSGQMTRSYYGAVAIRDTAWR